MKPRPDRYTPAWPKKALVWVTQGELGVPKPGSWWREAPVEFVVCPWGQGMRKFHKIR